MRIFNNARPVRVVQDSAPSLARQKQDGNAAEPQCRNVSVLKVSVKGLFSPNASLIEGVPMNRFRAHSRSMWRLTCLVLALGLVPAVCAQTDTGTVRGTVTDQQGVVVTD